MSKMKRRSDEKKSRVTWSDVEDGKLLKAVLEDKQDREAEGDTEDEEDWDEIAKNIPNKTPVQCLKRYMVLNQRKSEAKPSAPEVIAMKAGQVEGKMKAVDEEEVAPDEEEEDEKDTKRARKEIGRAHV